MPSINVNVKMHVGGVIMFVCMLIITSATKDAVIISLLVRDFVKVMPIPLKIIAFLCWEKDSLVKLSKLLSINFIQHDLFRADDPDMYLYRNSDNLLIMTEAECEVSMKFLFGVKNNFFTDRQHLWLTFSSNRSADEISKLYLNINGQFYVSTPENYSGEYHIFEYYKYHPHDPTMVKEHIFSWRSSAGFSGGDKRIKFAPRYNLMGAKLPVSIVVTNKDKWNDLWNFRDTDVDGFSKHHFMLVEILIDYLNATRFYREQKVWGYKDKVTKYHSGVYGDLERGFSELAGLAGFVIDSRVEIVDFLPLTTKTDYTFIYRSPRITYTKNLYIILYERSVWYCWITLVFIGYLVLYFAMKHEWMTRYLYSKKQQEEIIEPSAMKAVIICTEAVTLQGVEYKPRNMSARIVLFSYCIVVYFLFTCYSAHITVLLQTPSAHDLTLEDLLNSNIELGAEDVSYNYFFLKNLDDPLKRRIYEEKVADNFMAIRKGMEMVRDNFFGFHSFAIDTYKTIGEIFPDYQRCGLKLFNFLNLPADTAYSVKKNSTYKEIIKIGMMRIYESGIRWRIYYRIFGEIPKCESSGRNFVSIGLIDCYYLFAFLAAGVVFSLMILTAEILVHKYYKE